MKKNNPINRIVSLPGAVILLAIFILFMLVGVIPSRGGMQGTIFSSPVFIALLALLGLCTLACVFHRKFSFRFISYHLTHIAVVCILIGAFIGYMTEKRALFQIFVGEEHPTRHISLPDGTIVDLGFSLFLDDFLVEHYNPNLSVLIDDELVDTHRIEKDALIELSDNQHIIINDIIPNAEITDYKLSRNPELIIYQNKKVWKRVDLTQEEKEIVLPDGDQLLIMKSYNNLPNMKAGEKYAETSYPANPGLIARMIGKDSMATLSISARKGTTLLSSNHESPENSIPTMIYDYPDLEELSFRSSETPGGTAVAFTDASGQQHYLLQNAAMLDRVSLGEGITLQVTPPIDKDYTGKIRIIDDMGQEHLHPLKSNTPVDFAGWRLYLNSYGYEEKPYILVTARHDPGDKLVHLGIIVLMIAIAGIFYLKPSTQRTV